MQVRLYGPSGRILNLTFEVASAPQGKLEPGTYTAVVTDVTQEGGVRDEKVLGFLKEFAEALPTYQREPEDYKSAFYCRYCDAVDGAYGNWSASLELDSNHRETCLWRRVRDYLREMKRGA